MPKVGTTPSSAVDPAWPEAAWVREMHAHFARTGSYRPQDVRRVLGNPQEGVGLPASPSERVGSSKRDPERW